MTEIRGEGSDSLDILQPTMLKIMVRCIEPCVKQ